MLGSRNQSSSILGRAIASPSHTQGGSRMRESRPYGSVRGARDETRVPTATAKLAIAAMHESESGPSRHFAAARQLGRFWRKADINWRAGPAGSVANDPTAI